MKNYLYGIFAIAFLAFTACTNEELPTPGTGQDTPVEHKSGEILVKFSPYVSKILDKTAAATRSGGPATRSGILSVDEVLDIVGGYQIERVFPVDGRNEERTRESELHLWYVVRFGDDYSEEVAEKLSALGEVQHVNLNRTIRRAYNAGKKAMPLTREALAAMQRATRAAGDTGYPFNDELLPMQWHLINRGNLFGDKSIVDADVQCEEAWKSSTGDKSIIVAVLDEGVMVEHPDLKNSMWVNEGEVYRSKQDNDGNGYKGDVYGYNFVFETGVISWDDINDTGHGTHVAGVIAEQQRHRHQLDRRRQRRHPGREDHELPDILGQHGQQLAGDRPGHQIRGRQRRRHPAVQLGLCLGQRQQLRMGDAGLQGRRGVGDERPAGKGRPRLLPA